MSENMRGALLMMGAMLAFTVNDAITKTLLVEMPIFQILFLRGVGAVTILFAISRRMAPPVRPPDRRDRRLLVVRTVAELATTLLFFAALPRLALPTISAIYQMAPLMLTLAAALLFRERLRAVQLGAILVGFTGVMLIVRPGTQGFGAPALLAFGSVAAVVVRDLATRRLSRGVSALKATLIALIAMTILSGLATLGETWSPPSAWAVIGVLGTTACVTSGYMLSVAAMRSGEIAVVSSFRYTGLIWALVIGWFGFGFWPDALSLLGVGLIAGTGLAALARELSLRRRGSRLRDAHCAVLGDD